MPTLDTDLYGEVQQPDTFTELLERCAQCLDGSGRVRMWRGQADISWPIHSSAYRRLLSTDQPITEDSFRRYEKHLLEQATHRGYRITPSGPLSDFELLGRLQHHGAATRLVDTTRSALVALWFAVSAHIDKTGAIFGIHTDYLHGYEGETETRTHAEVMAALDETPGLYTWEPTAVSARVAAQHSQFVFSNYCDDPQGSLFLPPETGATLVLALSPELKAAARDLLVQTFDIRDITIFPDIDGFCRANAQSVDRWDMFRW